MSGSDMTGIDTSGATRALKIAVGRSRREHPAARAWYEHGKTISAIAGEIGETRARVNSWLTDDPVALRPIPRKHVAYFERTYGIPATAWRRVAD